MRVTPILPAVILSLAIFATNLQGELITFDVGWTDPLGSSVRIDAVVVIDDTILPNPGSGRGLPSEIGIVSLNLVVNYPPLANEVFSEIDFPFVFWNTNGATLDLTSELFGQPTSNLPWGTASNGVFTSLAGDFNLLSSLSRQGVPRATAPFELATSLGANGVLLTMTNFTPRPVPEPASPTMTIVLMLFGVRCRKKRIVA